MRNAASLTGVLRWEDPPPPAVGGNGPRRPWALVAAQLRERPGCWALIDDSTTFPAYTARITAGVGWWAPRGAFEACVRGVEGRLCMYARFVGGRQVPGGVLGRAGERGGDHG